MFTTEYKERLDNTTNRRSDGFCVLDMVALLWLIWGCYCHFAKMDAGCELLSVRCESERVFHYLLFMMAVYLLFRILSMLIDNRHLLNTFLIILCITCSVEIVAGIIELYRILILKQRIILSGTFFTSGLYGGFLSISSCLLLSYSFGGTDIKRKICRIISLISLFMLPSIGSRAAVLSFFVTGLIYAFHVPNYRSYLKRHWIVIVISTIILGSVAYLIKKQSADGRFYMARISASSVVHNGLMGSGVGNYGGGYRNCQTGFWQNYVAKLLSEPNSSINIKNASYTQLMDSMLDNPQAIAEPHFTKFRQVAECPEYAFSEISRELVEKGPISLCLLLVLFFLSLFYLWREDSILKYGLISYSVFSLFYYPSESSLFNLLFCFIISFSASYGKGLLSRNKTIVLFLMALLPLIVFISFNVLPLYLKQKKAEEYWTEKVHPMHERRNYDIIVYEGDSLFPSLCYDKSFLYEYGHSLSLVGEYEKSDSILKMGYNSSSDPVFLNAMGNNWLYQNQFDKAEEMFCESFISLPNRMYPLYSLARLYFEKQDYKKINKIYQLVCMFKPKIESGYTKKMRLEIDELLEKSNQIGNVKEE